MKRSKRWKRGRWIVTAAVVGCAGGVFVHGLSQPPAEEELERRRRAEATRMDERDEEWLELLGDSAEAGEEVSTPPTEARRLGPPPARAQEESGR